MLTEVQQRLQATVTRIADEISDPKSSDDWWVEWLEDNPNEGYTDGDEPQAHAYFRTLSTLSTRSLPEGST